MMRAILGFLLLSVIAAQSASAGAWLRERGTGFVSLGSTLRNPDGLWRPEYGFFGEYGVAQRLTLGLDINQNRGQAGHVLIFARVPVGRLSGPMKMSFELGVGANHRLGRWDGMIKTTLSVGRGIVTPWGNGWVNVDAALELRRPDPKPALKLDATIGLSNGRRIRPLLQFEAFRISGQPLIWSVIPGVMIDGPNTTTWVLGIERKTTDRARLGLKFALWRKF